jgi:hypothetical protein
VVVAALLALGLHAGLAVGEVAVRRDVTYTQTMQHERDRVIAKELQAWQRSQAARGQEIDEAARRAERERLAQQHRTFPFVWLLAAATLASAIAGARRMRHQPDERIGGRLLAITTGLAAASIAAVVVIDALVAM